MTKCDDARAWLGARAARPRAARPPYAGTMSEPIFERERDASRWTLRRDGEILSSLDYSDDGRTVAMTRAFTNPRHRGSGWAAVIVDRAVTELEEAGDRRVLPVCWYVAEWFDKNPDRSGILAPRG